MGRKEVIGDCTLYLGDCMEIMPTLGKVDAVVTDPPYGIIHNYGVHNNSKGGKTNKGFLYGDLKDGEHLNIKINQAIAFAAGLAIENIFTFCGTSQISLLEKTLFEEKFTPKLFVWHKTTYAPPVPKGKWASSCELALFAYKPNSYFGDNNAYRANIYMSDTYRHGIRAGEKVDHPTQKWLPLMHHIVKSTVRPGGVCLDPFMGSGTTGVACVKLGRKFIGIELEEKYFDIACKRIEEAYSQPDLFVPQPAKVKQETFL